MLGICKNVLQPKSDEWFFIGYIQKKILGIPFITVPKTKVFVVKNDKFLKKVFLAKGEWEDSTIRRD